MVAYLFSCHSRTCVWHLGRSTQEPLQGTQWQSRREICFLAMNCSAKYLLLSMEKKRNGTRMALLIVIFLISEHYITLSHPQKILSNFCQLPALVLVEQTHQSYDLLSLSDRKTCKTTTPATFMKRPHTASKQLSCSSMYCLKSGSWKNLEEFTQNLPLPLEPDMSTIISQWNGRFRFRMTCPVTNGESYWEVCWPERWSVEISPFLFSSTRLHLKRDLQTVRELHNYI